MPLFERDTLCYHYQDQGHGQPLVLLHGFTGSSASWLPLFPDLSPGRRLLVVDLPGHGRTDTPANPGRTAMSAVAADLAALLKALDAAPVDILGYSMGGRVALFFALEYPELVNRLVLESASPGLANPSERVARRRNDEALANRLEAEGIAAFVDYWESLALWDSQRSLPTTTRHSLRQHRLANDPAGLAASLRGLGTGAQPSLWDRLPELARPTLLVAGALDHKFIDLNRQMVTAIPGAQLAIIPGTGHTIHLEQPTLFARQVNRFLAVTTPPDSA